MRANVTTLAIRVLSVRIVPPTDVPTLLSILMMNAGIIVFGYVGFLSQ